jgi:hypothetical protein
MEVVIIDVPYAWSMLLSHKWETNLGGSLQMDLSIATIPTCEGTYVTLYCEQFIIFHVQDPNESMNEFVWILDDNISDYAILSHSLSPNIKEEEVERTKDDIWKMHFDGAHS